MKIQSFGIVSYIGFGFYIYFVFHKRHKISCYQLREKRPPYPTCCYWSLFMRGVGRGTKEKRVEKTKFSVSKRLGKSKTTQGLGNKNLLSFPKYDESYVNIICKSIRVI